MGEKARERSEKAEVTETFCGPLKGTQKDICVQFYEEFAEEEGKKDPGEKSDPAPRKAPRSIRRS